MWWRLKRSEFERLKGENNKRRFRRIVESGKVPGLLAYAEGRPVAWCAVAPREDYPALERSRVLKPVDGQPVWSVTCLFVARPFRQKGISVKLLKAAAEYARAQGCKVVEGYPVESRKGRMPDAFAYTGLPSAFRAAGFVEVARRSPIRPIMRYVVRERSAK